MPFSLLIALFVAFGYDASARLGPLPRAEVVSRLEETLALMAAVAAVAFAIGRWVAVRVARRGHASHAIRRRHAWSVRLVEALTLTVYAYIVHDVGWPWVVRSCHGPDAWPLLDDIAVVLPFLLMQVAAWTGLFAAERALRSRSESEGAPGLGRHLILKGRQSLGLVLPVVVVFAIGQGLGAREWPESLRGPWSQLFGVALMGATVLILAPVFVRLAWPTRPLAAGPLRDRLERLARRYGFRCTDILVWDTGRALVNAGVTGALPWFRYVLLTDALIEYLDDHEVAAVFGHEIGHIAHRHLLDFGLFFLGSLGVLALMLGAIDALLPAVAWLPASWNDPEVTTLVESSGAVVAVGLYFLGVFGFVSRRFERQADVFGCRAVSCSQGDCPPHADPNGLPGPVATTTALCPVGIRIFANALSNVASLNGMELARRSWRHGSIASRIAFLERLEGRPDAERRFQRQIARLRLVVALGLIAAVLIARANGSFVHLR